MPARSPAHPATAAHAVGLGALWFGVFGAPLVWSLQLLLGYSLVAHSCFPGAEPRATPVIGGLWSILLVVSVGAAVVALAAGGTAWRSWRMTRQEHRGDHGELLEVAEGRTRFMALAGMLLSSLFLLGIVLNALPLFLVPACG